MGNSVAAKAAIKDGKLSRTLFEEAFKGKETLSYTEGWKFLKTASKKLGVVLKKEEALLLLATWDTTPNGADGKGELTKADFER